MKKVFLGGGLVKVRFYGGLTKVVTYEDWLRKRKAEEKKTSNWTHFIRRLKRRIWNFSSVTQKDLTNRIIWLLFKYIC